MFHFVGVLYLVYGYLPLGFPPLRQINSIVLFAAAVLLALIAAVYSFRVIVKRFASEVPVALRSEIAESVAGSERKTQPQVPRQDEAL